MSKDLGRVGGVTHLVANACRLRDLSATGRVGCVTYCNESPSTETTLTAAKHFDFARGGTRGRVTAKICIKDL